MEQYSNWNQNLAENPPVINMRSPGQQQNPPQEYFKPEFQQQELHQNAQEQLDQNNQALQRGNCCMLEPTQPSSSIGDARNNGQRRKFFFIFNSINSAFHIWRIMDRLA